MDLSVQYNNETLSASHIHALLSIISIMSSHFLVRSFSILANLEPRAVLNIQKLAADSYIEIGVGNSIGDAEGYIIIQKPGFDFQQMEKTRAKLIMAVFVTTEINAELPPDVIIPSSTSFFMVFLSNKLGNLLPVQGKCFRIYKPTANYTSRIFPLLTYAGVNDTKWHWHDKRTDWNSYKKDILNMTDVTVTIGLASQHDKNIVARGFLKNKNSFFWRALGDFLKFRTVIQVEYIVPQALRNISSIYLKLLMTAVDGLGVLPVMTADRAHKSLEFLITGLDSKYHLMVRSPQYIYSWQTTIKPFSLKSWFCLGLTIILISLVLKIVTCWKTAPGNSTCCFLMVFGFICSQGSPSIPREISARFVCYTALLFSIVIYQYYTSNFCSLLATKEVSLPFTSLDQFIARRSHPLYIHPDTGIYTHILKAKSGVFKKLHDEILKKDPGHQLTSVNQKSVIGKVCKGAGAIFGLPYQTIYLKELSCSLVPVNSGYFPTSFATTIRKNFPFKPQFKFVSAFRHLRLLEAGVTHKFKEEFFDFKEQRPTKADVTNEPVSLNHVAFPFVFYAAFLVLSVLVFCFEIVFFRSFSKDKQKFTGL